MDGICRNPPDTLTPLFLTSGSIVNPLRLDDFFHQLILNGIHGIKERSGLERWIPIFKVLKNRI